ncbi:MAG: S41 family peptidase [Chitinophagaceae bacterium]
MKRFFIFCLVIFFTTCISKSNKSQQGTIATKALQKDLAILKKTFEEAHPGLYWYSTQAAIDSLFDSAKGSIRDDMTQLEFFKILLPLIAGINCSHTNMRLPRNENNSVALPFTNLLPVELYVVNAKGYIRRQFSGNGFEGAEVLSINGVPLPEILAKLMSAIPADGYNESYKYQALNRGVMVEGYALHFGDTAVYTMEIKDSSGSMHTIRLDAASPQQIRATIPPPLPGFSVHYKDSVGILAINSFQLNTAAFTDSVSTIFRELQAKNIHQLIIDLRQNGGGNNENVSTLFSFIARSSFRHLRQAEMLGKKLTWSSYISNATGIDRYPRTHPNGDRYLVNDSYSGTRLSHPRDSFHFAGDVVLLISGATVSAASEFVAVFHDQQRGKIVGEETGGCYYGSTGGNYLQLRLPNSGLEIRIPTIRIFTAVEEDYVKQPKGRGTFPDYTIIPTVEDVMAGKDVQLEKAMELLR